MSGLLSVSDLVDMPWVLEFVGLRHHMDSIVNNLTGDLDE